MKDNKVLKYVDKRMQEILKRIKLLSIKKGVDKSIGSLKKPKILKIKDRFSFSDGQVFFDDKDLELPTGFTIDIFQKLYESWGRTVLHKKLHDMSDPGQASEQLKKAKLKISQSFKRYKVPCIIESKAREGYLIKEKTRQK